MVSAMMKNMAQEEFEVIPCAPVFEDFIGIENRPRVVLVYMDRNVPDMSAFLREMDGLLAGDDEAASLYLIGSEEEIGEARAFFTEPDRCIAGTFTRPLNVRELCEHLGGVLEEEARTLGKKRILVVDDDGTMLRTLKLWLSDRYHVYMANSGANAMTLLERKKVDLILLDYEMPVADGPKVLAMLRENPATADIPVMFLTAKNDAESAMAGIPVKPEKYLLKTMPPDLLMEEMEGFFKK